MTTPQVLHYAFTVPAGQPWVMTLPIDTQDREGRYARVIAFRNGFTTEATHVGFGLFEIAWSAPDVGVWRVVIIGVRLDGDHEVVANVQLCVLGPAVPPPAIPSVTWHEGPPAPRPRRGLNLEGE